VGPGTTDATLLGFLLQRHHYLGHRNCVGENLRYLLREQDWVGRFERRYRDRPPAEVREAELRAFLNGLAQAGQVSASTQRQALNAPVFLFREVMGHQLGDLMFMCSIGRGRRCGVRRTSVNSRWPIANRQRVIPKDGVRPSIAGSK